MGEGSPDSGELLGRPDELASAAQLISEACGGRGATLYVEGEGGIGKSRFLEECAELARSRGAAVVSAAASVLETERPFGVMTEAFLGSRPAILPPASPALAALLDPAAAPMPGTPGDEPGTRFRTVEAIVDDVERATLSLPVAIVVDDLQWADASSLLAIDALARRIGALSVTLLLAGRPPLPGTPHERLVVALSRAAASMLRLGPLDDRTVTRLAERLLGATPGPNLRKKLHAASGNPFYVTALVDGLVRDDVLCFHETGVEATDPGLPPALQLTILRGLQLMDVETRAMLRTASVLGSSFSLADLALLEGRSPLDTWTNLEPAVTAGFVHDHAGRLAFRHDLVREAIYGDIPLPLRRQLHREAARVLAGAGRPATAVAAHLLYCESGEDRQAAVWLRRAATDTAARAPESAVAFLRRGIELLPFGDSERDQMRVELLMTLVWSARLDEAETLATQLLQGPVDPRLAGPATLGLGWAFWVAGKTTAAAHVFRSGAHDTSLAPRDRARLAAFAAWIVGFQLGRTDEARPYVAHALAEGDRAGDDLASCMGEAAGAAADYFAGRLSSAIDQICRLITRLEASSSPELQRVAGHVLLSLVLVEGDRLDEADEVLRRGRGASERAGAASSLAIWHRTHALRHFAVGDWDDALAEVEAGLTMAAEAGTSLGSVAGHAIAALVFIRRGELAAAAAAIAAAEETQERNGPEYRSQWTAWAAAALAEASGDMAGALEMLSSAWDDCRTRDMVFELPWFGPDLVRLALALGRSELAESIAMQAAELPDRSEIPSVDAAALRCRGLVDSDPDVLLAAVSRARTGPRRYALAGALADAGHALTGAGRLDEARAALEEAVTIFEALGATADAQRAIAVLRRAGIRRGSRGPRGRPATGWAGLTPSEARVAALVADGLTNREIADRLFVSRRTVETHVARVLTKLGMRSRVQVIRAAAARSAEDTGAASGR